MVLVKILTAFQRFPFKPVILSMATSTWLTSEQKVLYIVRAATFLIFPCSFKAAHIHLSITCHRCMHKFIQLIFSSLNYILRLILLPCFIMQHELFLTVIHFLSRNSQQASVSWFRSTSLFIKRVISHSPGTRLTRSCMYKILLNFTFWRLINSITASPVLPILSNSIFRKAIIIQVHD